MTQWKRRYTKRGTSCSTDKHNLMKICQIAIHKSCVNHSAHCTDLCMTQFADFLRLHKVTSNNFTHNLLFYFTIVFSITFDSLFSIFAQSTCCTFTPGCSGLCSFTCAAARSQLLLFVVLAGGLVFHCGLGPRHNLPSFPGSATSEIEKVGMYREKSALEELLSRASAADDSWEHSSDLTSSSRFLLTRSSTYFFESNLASSWAPLRSSHWKLDLDLHLRQIKVDMLFLWSHTPRSSFLSTQAHHFVSISSSVKKTIETFLEAVLPRKAPNKGSMTWSPDRNKLLSKKGRAGWNGFQFSRF